MGIWGEVEGKLIVRVYRPSNETKGKTIYDSFMIKNYFTHVLDAYKTAMYYGDNPTKIVHQMQSSVTSFPHYSVHSYNYKENAKCDVSHCVRDVTPVWDGMFEYAILTNRIDYEHIATHDDAWVAEDLDDLYKNQTTYTFISTYEIPIHIIDRQLFGETIIEHVKDLIKFLESTEDLRLKVNYDLVMFNGTESIKPVLYTNTDSYAGGFAKIIYEGESDDEDLVNTEDSKETE